MSRFTRADFAALSVLLVLGVVGIFCVVSDVAIGAIAAIAALVVAGASAFLFARRKFNIRGRRVAAVMEASTSPIKVTAPGLRLTPDAIDREKPKLSIVMPVYNVAPYLESAILSVLYQDLQDFELIIIDDASTDGSSSIIEMYAALDSRVRVLTLEQNSNGGAGIPSNLGIRAARGEYLGFADSDDIMMRTAHSHMVALADHHSADVVVGNFATFTDGDHVLTPAYDVARAADIPKNQVVSATEYPELLSMSPVPWRKLYRLSFMREHAIEYPEGDYFFEDNPLHWAVLAGANRVVVTDEVVSHHRMGRAGQTMESAEHRKGAFAQHFANALKSVLSTTGDRRDALLNAYVDRLLAARWVIRDQNHAGARAMLAKRFAMLFDRVATQGGRIPLPMRRIVGSYRGAYPTLDLSVVIATRNAGPRVRKTLDSLLAVRRIDLDIIVIDDGSTDDTRSVLREYESAHGNVNVFFQDQRGIGRARNSVIPLITGKLALFMNAGDVVDPDALSKTVRDVDVQASDLTMLAQSSFSSPDTVAEVRAIAAAQENIAWNRLVRTDFLHDADIFFGGADPYEDLQFHWLTVARAHSIALRSARVVHPTKFASKRATQIDNSAPAEQVHGSIWFTEQSLRRAPTYGAVHSAWRDAVATLLHATQITLPEAVSEEFGRRSKALLTEIN